MIYISHRGNLDGINTKRENSLDYIDEAINAGYDVEIDLRCKNNRLFLGHDTPDYPVADDWLRERKDSLWIHVKDYFSLVWILKNDFGYKYFCHENDRYTLTSNGYVWSHDLKNKMTDRCIVPLLSKKQIERFSQRKFYAVCTDYPVFCKNFFGGKQ
jgi:hypothetical protein